MVCNGRPAAISTDTGRRGVVARRWAGWVVPAALALLGAVSLPAAPAHGQGIKPPVQIQPSQGRPNPQGRTISNTNGAGTQASSGNTTASAATPSAANPNKPVLVGWASLGSFDRLQQLFRDAGFNKTPDVLAPSAVEQKLSFIGSGGINPSQPVAFGFFAGRGVDPMKSAVVLLPVRPGRALLDQFTRGGARMVPGSTDTCVLGPMAFRRAAAAERGGSDYMVFGFLTDQVRYAKPEFFAGPYRKGTGGADSLANLMVDFRALRQANGDQFERYLRDEELRAYSNKGRGGYEGAKLVSDAFRSLDRLTVTIDRPAGGLRVAANVQPFAFDASARLANFERPGFPAGVAYRVDFSYPPRKALGFADELLNRAITQGGGMAEVRGIKAEQQLQMAALVQKLVGLFLDGRAGSFAGEAIKTADANAAPIFVHYVISQRLQGNDIGTALRQVANDGEMLGRQLGAGPLCQLQAYPAADGTTKVWRLCLLTRGVPCFFIDAIQRDQTVYLSATTHDGHHVERLLDPSLKPIGPVPGQSIAAGSLNPEAMFRILQQTPPGPNTPVHLLTGMGEADRARLFALLKGQRLQWTATTDGTGLTIDLTVPPKMLANVAQLADVLDLN